MVTNVETEKMGVEELAKLYRLRWKIELSFKAWKQSGQLENTLARKSNKYYMGSMVVAGIIRFMLSFQLYTILGETKRLSMEKLFKRFCEWLEELGSFANIESLEDFSEDIRHIQRDLRRRPSLDDLLADIFSCSLA